MVGRHYRRWGLFLAVLAFGLTLALVVVFLGPLPDLDPYRSGPPEERWAALSRQLEVWREAGIKHKPRFVYVPLAEVSDHLLVAILVGEDINFFQHGGVDFRAWPEVWRQWREGRRLRGGSTITQQLAKNLFLSRERSLKRKLSELRLSWYLERELGKRRILELYVNIVEFGPGIFGAEAASQTYFGCSARDLSPAQAAALAATIPAPARDNPKTESPRFQARARIIAQRASNARWLYQLVRETKAREPSPHR